MACSIWPCCIIRTVSKENDEKVVNPPQKPMRSNCFMGPSCSGIFANQPASIPATKQPNTLLMKVPQGHEDGRSRWANKEHPQRLTLPNAPPRAVNRNNRNIRVNYKTRIYIRNVLFKTKRRKVVYLSRSIMALFRTIFFVFRVVFLRVN